MVQSFIVVCTHDVMVYSVQLVNNNTGSVHYTLFQLFRLISCRIGCILLLLFPNHLPHLAIALCNYTPGCTLTSFVSGCIKDETNEARYDPVCGKGGYWGRERGCGLLGQGEGVDEDLVCQLLSEI